MIDQCWWLSVFAPYRPFVLFTPLPLKIAPEGVSAHFENHRASGPLSTIFIPSVIEKNTSEDIQAHTQMCCEPQHKIVVCICRLVGIIYSRH